MTNHKNVCVGGLIQGYHFTLMNHKEVQRIKYANGVYQKTATHDEQGVIIWQWQQTSKLTPQDN